MSNTNMHYGERKCKSNRSSKHFFVSMAAVDNCHCKSFTHKPIHITVNSSNSVFWVLSETVFVINRLDFDEINTFSKLWQNLSFWFTLEYKLEKNEPVVQYFEKTFAKARYIHVWLHTSLSLLPQSLLHYIWQWFCKK